MAYVVNQPTLISTWPELDAFVRSLGPLLACAWCALERSRTASAPIASGSLGSEALDTLASLEVLDRAYAEGSIYTARSLYESLAWSYRHRWSRPDVDLEALLLDILTRWTIDCPPEAKRRLGATSLKAKLGPTWPTWPTCYGSIDFPPLWGTACGALNLWSGLCSARDGRGMCCGQAYATPPLNFSRRT